MSWMAWTLPTAVFFVAIFAMLAGMLAWERLAPTRARRGLLPLVNTRGDRLFIGLITTAFVHLAWLGLSDQPVWPVSIACLGLMLVIVRWG